MHQVGASAAEFLSAEGTSKDSERLADRAPANIIPLGQNVQSRETE
jgi:hypothetical protein